jgi:hypothetical protein
MLRVLTKKQAVAILVQVENKISNIDIFYQVKESHKLFKLTNEELEKKLNNYMEDLAGVVDEVEM